MSSDSDSDDANDYQMKKMLVCHRAKEISLLCSNGAHIAAKFSANWLLKAEARTSVLTGFGWLQETTDTPGETYTMLRMSARVFFDLHDLLVDRYGNRWDSHKGSHSPEPAS